ncbi:hypothetical protein ACN9MB_13045 [Dyella kyungheensis]|uniref:hypothetical protein n=1 Tax=Dyella kyungheensis TaxID=1242174 RepID=UPI003CE6F9DC
MASVKLVKRKAGGYDTYIDGHKIDGVLSVKLSEPRVNEILTLDVVLSLDQFEITDEEQTA